MQIEHITPDQWLALAVLLGGSISAFYWVRHWYRYFFDRHTVWRRKFGTSAYRTSRYYADKHGEVESHLDRYKAWRGINTVRGERRRLSDAEKQEVRNKAHRSL